MNMMNKILVTGVNGQLGHDVMIELKKRNIEAVGADISDFDITDEKSTDEFFEKTKPTGVIHCAAYTAVDKAENEVEVCEKVNVTGTENIVKACKKYDAKVIFISTDYVFSAGGEDFSEIDTPRKPLNQYGRTKMLAENIVAGYRKSFIVRTSWVFGINGGNFVKTMLKLAETKESLTVVGDQVGSPTYTVDLAVLLCDMIVTEKYGIYHATNENICSWAEFAKKIMDAAGKNMKIISVPTSEYKTIAKRPLNSRLSKKSLDNAGFSRLPDWEDALNRYMTELKSIYRF